MANIMVVGRAPPALPVAACRRFETGAWFDMKRCVSVALSMAGMTAIRQQG